MKNNFEIWKDVPGWEGRYQVSSFGGVCSLDRAYYTDKHGANTRYKGKKLACCTLKSGYRTVHLSRPGQKPTIFYVHDLVLLAFTGPKPKGLEVCHNDGTRDNNNIENLRYDTRSNNAQDRHKHGTIIRRCGVDAPNAKLDWDKVESIRNNRDGLSFRALGRKYGVCHGVISGIIKGKYWLTE